MDPGGGESNVTSEGGEGDGVTEALVLAQLVASSTNLILIFVYWTYLLYASISRCVQTLSLNLMQSNQPTKRQKIEPHDPYVIFRQQNMCSLRCIVKCI